MAKSQVASIEDVLGGRTLVYGKGRKTEGLEWAVREGLSVRSFEKVAEALALKIGELASLIGVAPRTMARRKQAKVLSAIESDRLVAIARIAAHAEETLGSRKAAQGWLRGPILALGNTAPIEYLDTEPGRRRVEDVLYQIDYGMY